MLGMNHNLLQGYNPALHDGYARYHHSSLHFNSYTDDAGPKELMIEGALCTTNTGNATPSNGFPMPFGGVIDNISIALRAGTVWSSNPLSVPTLELYVKSFAGVGGSVWTATLSSLSTTPSDAYYVDLNIPFNAFDFFTMYKAAPAGSTVYDVIVRVGVKFDGSLIS
jgi:hypothetical protein